MAENVGKVTQVIGPTVDCEFDPDHLPNILNAIKIEDKERDIDLVVEASSHLGDSIVRCVAMDSTDGLVRGMDVVNTGEPISVPVGPETLGRMLNVVGFVDDNVYKDNLIFDDSPVLGGTEHLPDLVEKHHIDILIFAIDRISLNRRKKIEAICQATGAQIINARDLPSTMGAVIGLEKPFEGLFRSTDEAQQFLDQLDDYLLKKDIVAAQELLNQARSALNNQEEELFE